MPAAPDTSPDLIKDANTRYHDAAAAEYDGKWGIDFGEIGQEQVTAKVTKALGDAPERPFRNALEIGAGTGYFGINLLQAGVIENLTATDISSGMLASLGATAKRLGLKPKVRTARTEAEDLPFRRESFDLVFGHAILHHIPDLEQACVEFHRVLRPGGTLVFCGEPSRYGDWLAAVPKRGGLAVAPLWRRLVGAGARRHDPACSGDGHELESVVDVHAFTPGDLRAPLTSAGFDDVRVRGEELLANMHGWAIRTVEATAEPDEVPWGWRRFAYRSYIALQRVDSTLLEPRLPPQLFYNLLVSARKS
jgi:ubiquinone/menaquinone biosynthesis C-methylase UbiE